MSVPVEPNPYASPKVRRPLLAGAGSLPMMAAWSVVVALGGGLACGWCISQLSELGELSLAACGALGGYVSRKITRRPCKVGGILQVAATCLAFFVAQTCWLHWNTRNGETSWWAAVCLWPIFVREYSTAAAIGAACTAYGAWCAYDYATRPDQRPAEFVPPAPPP